MLLKNKINDVGIVKDMFETVNVIKKFDISKVKNFLSNVSKNDKFLLTGEGSSRMFPSKSQIFYNLKIGAPFFIHSEGASQALEYDLKDFVLLAASNSGKTKEVIKFLKEKKSSFKKTVGITAFENTPLENECNQTYVLSCGDENAVAATKSVVEQALFEGSFFRSLANLESYNLDSISKNVDEVLNIDISDNICQKLQNASTVYFAGREDGVAEELVTKTKEIIRKRAVFLEGTYLLHGVEEVLQKDDCLVIVNPFESEEDTIKKLIEENIGVNIIAICHRDTKFQTIKINNNCVFEQLVCGWNLLTQTALKIGIDPSKPVRARKIGNEF